MVPNTVPELLEEGLENQRRLTAGPAPEPVGGGGGVPRRVPAKALLLSRAVTATRTSRARPEPMDGDCFIRRYLKSGPP